MVQEVGVVAFVASRMYEVAARKMGRAWKQRANLKKHVTEEPFPKIRINISEPYNFTVEANKCLLVVLNFFTK